MAKQFFFVAIVPPEPLYSELQHLKERVNAEFNSKAWDVGKVFALAGGGVPL